jgi:DNA-binding response OmpR family regulator
MEKDLDIVGSGTDIAEALASVPAGPKPEVVIICVDIPEMMRVRTWAVLRSLLPHRINIIALTDGKNARILENALSAGTAALHPVDVPHGILCRAIRSVALGGVDFDPKMVVLTKRLLWEDADEDVVQVGGLSINLRNRHVSRWGKTIELSKLEFELLLQLSKRAGEAVTVEELLEAVWNTSLGTGGTMDQVKSCVKRLRRKLEPDPMHPRYVRWVCGAGYIIQDPRIGGGRS